MEKTYNTEYGTVTIKGHRRVDTTGCVQITEWKSHRDGETAIESIHCAGSDDWSRHDGIKYDAACYFCYAGVGHTRERHAQNIK